MRGFIDSSLWQVHLMQAIARFMRYGIMRDICLRMVFVACASAYMLMLSGCNDTESIELANELDKKTYAGLEHIFRDTSVIETNGKYMLLVFGANGCAYCENLKDDIKANMSLQHELLKHFTSYYINTSYSKLHAFRIGEQGHIQEHKLPTRKLAEIYRIGPTPTLVFATNEGKTILSYPSYLPPKQFYTLLEFIAQGSWKKAHGDEKQIASMLQQRLKAI